MFARIRKYLHAFLTTPLIAEDPDPQYSQGDLTEPSIRGEVAKKRNFSEAVTQYYWDIKMGLTGEENLMAVECPTCNAGVYVPCVEAVPGLDDWAGRLMHVGRYDFLTQVHAEYCQMIGRDVA